MQTYCHFLFHVTLEKNEKHNNRLYICTSGSDLPSYNYMHKIFVLFGEKKANKHMDNNSEIHAEGKNVKWINLSFEEIREIKEVLKIVTLLHFQIGWKVIYFPNVLSVWMYLQQSNFCIFTSAASILHYPHYSCHHTQSSKKKLNSFENKLYSCHLSVSPANCETAVKAIIFLFLAQL